MKPWQRAMLQRYGRVARSMGGVGVALLVAVPLMAGDNPVGRWLRGTDNPRLAFALVFVLALVPLVAAKVYRDRRAG